MRYLIAYVIGKLLGVIGKLTNRGSNLPGEIALKICPDLFKRLHPTGTIIAVTGSNGKTTTANMISFTLEKMGYSVVNNAKGSNLSGGVATSLLNAASFNGSVVSEYVVLEVDERYSPIIFKDFQPDYLLVTNLFRDQLTRNGNVDIIVEKLQQSIKNNVKLVLNGNDPISADILKENKRVYYGLARTAASTDESVNITHDAKACPRCHGKMQYDYYHYNHIGFYTCQNCGYHTPEFSYFANQVSLQDGTFMVNGIDCKTSYVAPFNILNITGAIAVMVETGLPIDEVCESISAFTIMKQRYEEFNINGRKAIMILSKNQNPVSFDQSISYVLDLKDKKKSVIIVVNNINHTHQKDTTWLYDIAFERLVGHVESVICCGQRAFDMAVRMKLAGMDENQVLISESVGEVKKLVENNESTLCILTELYDAKSILKAIRG